MKIARIVRVLALLAALAPRAARAQRFFDSDSVLAFTLRADLHALFSDRDTANASWRPATITWMSGDSSRTVPLQVRTRGVFRRGYCEVPPIRLRFANDSVHGTPWHGLHRPKLVTHCMDRDEYEQNTLQEYALYKVYRLFTPLSYSVRLVRITWEDASGRARPVTRYGFILEDPDRFFDRQHATALHSIGIRFGQLDPLNATLIGVFEYLIANTDWSLPAKHNIAVFRQDSVLKAVPYDFDWSGVIDARYARPDPRLHIRSVTDRVYRGFCQDEADLAPTLARFVAMKDSIAAVYRAVPGLQPRTVQKALRYFDDFFHDAADPRRFAQDVVRNSCLR